ncbi:MAG: MFS transporter, partial [Hyphomicrobiaceae bacterium]
MADERAVPTGLGAEPDAKPARTLTTVCAAHAAHDGVHDSIYVLLPLWAEAFGLNYAQVGLLKSAFSGALAMFQMPAGILSERLGERFLLVLGTAAAGIGYAMLGLSTSFLMLFAIVALTGLASSVQHPIGSAVISKAFAQGGRRAALGVYNFSGDVGKMAVALLLGSAVTYVGWRTATLGYGLVVVALSLVILVMLREIRGAAPPVLSPMSAAASGGWGFTDRRGYSVLSGIHVVDCACRTGVLTFVPFALAAKGASAATIGLAFALIFAGGAAGKLVCG